MNFKELKTRFRSERDDAALPYLWSDDDFAGYLSDAEAEACIRGRLLEDSLTPQVCRVALVANKDTYQLSSTIFHVERARRASDNVVVTLRTTDWLDDNAPGWDTDTGKPCHAVLSAGNKLRVVPIPTVADTLKLTVFRTPLERFKADHDSQCPEIPDVWHHGLLDWAYRCAYLKHDTDAYDPGKAAQFEALFTARFGERPDANVLRKQARRNPPIVKGCG